VEMPSVSFVSLGCPKNLVDSEKMLGLLADAGCPIVAEASGLAEVLVVNTCGFLAASRDEALETLRDAAEQKREGRIERLVVAGCLVQRDGQRLLEEVPEIDALVGVHNRGQIVRAVTADRGAGQGAKDSLLFLGEYHPQSWSGANKSDQTRLRLTPAHYAYLRISEGCDQKCTFCTIPSIRGPMHCKTPDEITAEARELIADGAREIMLIGQDTTSYGLDIGYGPGLAGLLRSLNTLDGLHWLRLMYVYPSVLRDEMIDAVAECDRVVKYIDIPLQHVNDRVLKAMYRRVTRGETETLLRKLRDRIPGVAIRTTLIAGFPGETEAEFEEMLEFVREFEFDLLGVFPYSDEPGTPSHRIKGHLPPKVIQERVEALMLAQQEVAFAKAASRVGDTFEVMIDDYGRGGVYPARHQGQAPQVDNLVYVEDGEQDPGDFVTVRCTASRGYDLIATPLTSSLPVLQ